MNMKCKIMLSVCCTRFTTESWKENKRWRHENKWKGCIYNVPRRMKPKILEDTYVMVIEMNNDTNKIMGIGIIENTVQRYKYVHKCNNYNRYTFLSNTRIDRSQFIDHDFIKEIELLLFKGSRHSKRGQGITELPSWILKDKDFKLKILKCLKEQEINIKFYIK